jgi:4-hydroxy-2-oxoheptanedioate aldolase
MNAERLRQALAARTPVFGTWAQTPSPEVVEILGWSGWDFVILDLEHGPYGTETIPNLIRAADASGVAPLVRVPASAPHDVGKVLDLGAAGVVTPGVTSASIGQSVVTLTLTAEDAVRPIVVLQVEARLATSDLASILDIDGLNVIFIGPYDLSTTLGLPGQFEHPKVREAIGEIVERAAQRNVAVGIWVPDAKSAHFWVERGVRFVSVSNNELMLFGASSALRRELES